MQQAMEKQAATERERRAIETLGVYCISSKRYGTLVRRRKQKCYNFRIEGKLETAKREAKASIKLALASAQAITDINQAIGKNRIEGMFLLSDRYINILKKLSESQNSKFIIYPADLQ